MDGYEVLIKAGFNASTPARGCSEEGIYKVDIRLPGTGKLIYSDDHGGACGPEHIRKIEGSYIGLDKTSIDLRFVLSSPTPKPGATLAETPTPFPTPSPEPPIKPGFVDCGTDMRAGGAARTFNNCWVGVAGRYGVEITTGKEDTFGGKYCDFYGFYEIYAWLPNANYYDDEFSSAGIRLYPGCGGPLHIKSVSGNVVTFDGSANLSVDLLAFIETRIQSDHWSKGVGGCPPDTGTDSQRRTSTGCWQGLVNGYDVFVRAGKVKDRPPTSGDTSCTMQGFYYVEAWAPDSPTSIEASIPPIGWHEVYSKWFYTGCSALHLGSDLSLNDESGNPVDFDIGSLLSTPTPTP